MAGTKRGLGSPNIDAATKHRIQSAGGQASSSKQDMRALGRQGGQSQGQQNNPGNFANRPREEVAAAGRSGGQS